MLFYYELLKLGKKRIIVGMVGLLLLVSCGLYTHAEWKKNSDLITKMPQLEKLEAEYRNLPQEEAWERTSEIVEDLTFFHLLSSEATIAEHNPDWHKQIEDQKQDNPDAVKRYNMSKYANDPEMLDQDMFLYEELHRQYQAIQNHGQYINEMEDKASDLLSVSIFHKENSFSYRNIHQTLEDFKPLKSIKLQIGLENGLVSATQFTPTDLCMVTLLFMLAFYLFHYEREAGLLRLIRSTKRGRVTTVISKLGVMTLLTFLFALLFYGSLLVIASKVYGFGDWNRYIQSMTAFKNSVHLLTVGQYITLYVILKAFACLLIGLLLALLFTLFRRPSPVFLFLLASIGMSFFFYTQIHPSSYANSIKYLNPVAFLDTFHMLADYRNINLSGYPVSKTLLSIITGSITIILLVVFTCIAYTLQWSLPFKLSFQKYIGLIRAWFFRHRKFNSLLHHEWYKLLISGKGLVFLLIGIGLMVQMLQSPARSFTMNEANYNKYMEQLTGPLDDEKKQFMESEALRFVELGLERQEGEDAYTSGLMTDDEYNNKKIEWNSFEKKEEAFYIVEQQYVNLLSVQEHTGLNVRFVNQLTSDELFNRQSQDTILAILFLTLLGTLLSTLFTQDYRNHAIILLRATPHGRGDLFRRKLVIAYCLVVVLLTLIYIPKYVLLLQHYPSMDWSAPIQSIGLYNELPWTVTVKQYVVLISMLQIFGSLVVVHMSQCLSIFVRKQTLSLLLQAAVLIIPLAITYLGFDTIIPYTVNGVFLAPYMLDSVNATLTIVLYISVLLLLCAGATVMSWRWYNGSFVKKE